METSDNVVSMQPWHSSYRVPDNELLLKRSVLRPNSVAGRRRRSSSG
jgi:hypothetical protein